MFILFFTHRKLKEKGEADPETTEVAELLTLTDEVRRLTSVKLGAKIKSASVLVGTTGEVRVGVTLANNTVELHSLRMDEGNEGKVCYITHLIHNLI